MAEVTIMVLKVDLQCSKCYKKVKKVLCKFPEIRDQVYDEKQNTVTIKVGSCCPKRLMQKIRCKGGKSIKSIEIKPPAKPEKKKEPEKEKSKEAKQKSEPVKEKPKETEKKKDADKPKEKKEAEKKTEDPKPTKPKVDIVDPPPKQKPAPTLNALEPALGYPPGYLNYPFGLCCGECYWGHVGGPCQHLGYGRPIWYDGYYGQPVYDSWGGGGCSGCSIGNYGSRRDYFSEENPSICSVM